MINMDYRKSFSANIRRLRISHGLSAQALAEILGVSQQAISLWELGKRSPTLEAVCAITKYFNVSLDALISDPSFDEESATLEPAM